MNLFKRICICLFLLFSICLANEDDDIFIGPFTIDGLVDPQNVNDLIANDNKIKDEVCPDNTDIDESGILIGKLYVDGYKKPINVDELIENNIKLIETVDPNYSENRDFENEFGSESEPIDVNSLPYPPAWAPGTTNHHPEVMNIVAFYTFEQNKGNKKFINFGTDYPYGNALPFGNATLWHYNGNECMKITDDGFTRSGAECEDYDPLKDAKAFTVMAWIWRRDPNGDTTQAATASRIVSDLAGTRRGPGFQVRLGQNGGNSHAEIWINPESDTDSISSKNNSILCPSNTTWVHIAVTFNGNATGENNKNRTTRFYINGVDYTPATPAQYSEKWRWKKGETISSNTALFAIGCSSGADSYEAQFVGLMDDLIIFKDWVPSSEDDVVFWKNINDTKRRDIDAIEGYEFGLADPRIKLFKANQIVNIINGRPPDE